ncbi:MAG: hypothetical protein V2A73_08930 [Pseudomonadota bacterium]
MRSDISSAPSSSAASRSCERRRPLPLADAACVTDTAADSVGADCLVDADGLARTLGIARFTVYKWAGKGLIPVVRLGRATTDSDRRWQAMEAEVSSLTTPHRPPAAGALFISAELWEQGTDRTGCEQKPLVVLFPVPSP